MGSCTVQLVDTLRVRSGLKHNVAIILYGKAQSKFKKMQRVAEETQGQVKEIQICLHLRTVVLLLNLRKEQGCDARSSWTLLIYYVSIPSLKELVYLHQKTAYTNKGSHFCKYFRADAALFIMQWHLGAGRERAFTIAFGPCPLCRDYYRLSETFEDIMYAR